MAIAAHEDAIRCMGLELQALKEEKTRAEQIIEALFQHIYYRNGTLILKNTEME